MKKTTLNKNDQMIAKIKRSLLMLKAWSNVPEDQHLELVSSVSERFEWIAKTRGLLTATSELKAARLAFTRWLAGRPIKGKVGAPIAPSGLPKVIPRSIRIGLSRDNDPLMKLILTCLSVSRLTKGGTPVDLRPIEEPSDPILPKVAETLMALDRLGIARGQDYPSFGDKGLFNWINTAGPNGPSLASSLTDLSLFNEKLRCPTSVMMPDLLDIIDTLLRWNDQIRLPQLLGLGKYPTDKLRKLSIKDDREGKSRVFAIFDYWSQTVLTPLHDWAYKTLRTIPQDCTFNQQEGVEKMLQLPKSGKHYYSYDLTSATDRFPAVWQRDVMSMIFDDEYGDAWIQMMTQEPFYLKGNPNPIKWGTGQPLGGKSSWAIFTICHHIVVRIAAARTNQPSEYVLLGDDIVIRGYKLASEYKRIMKQLGVSISPTKSHVSEDTFEFAKIWTRQGRNLSGFPIVGLVETWEKPLEMAALLLFESKNKGYLLDLCARSLSETMSPLVDLWIETPRLAVWRANLVCWYIAFLAWLHTGRSDWAKYMAQMADVHCTGESASTLISELTRRRWTEQVRKGLKDLKSYAWELARKIPDKLAFVDQDDDDMIIMGVSLPNVLQLADHLLEIPLFAALVNESERSYDAFLEGGGFQPVSHLSTEEIEAMKLPPKPQLKGFEPIRTKANVRALTLLTRELKSQIRCYMLQPERHGMTARRRRPKVASVGTRLP